MSERPGLEKFHADHRRMCEKCRDIEAINEGHEDAVRDLHDEVERLRAEAQAAIAFIQSLPLGVKVDASRLDLYLAWQNALAHRTLEGSEQAEVGRLRAYLQDAREANDNLWDENNRNLEDVKRLREALRWLRDNPIAGALATKETLAYLDSILEGTSDE